MTETPTPAPMSPRKAMEYAFHLGQTYWQQADHEFISQQRKSDATAQRFRELADATCAQYDNALTAEREARERAEAELAENEAVIRVWRGRAERAEAEAERLRGIIHDSYMALPIPPDQMAFADDVLTPHVRAVADEWAIRERQLAAEKAEAERLREDAERYRWLRGGTCADHSVRWTQWEVRCWRAPYWTGDLRRADLDAAIDAARKEGA